MGVTVLEATQNPSGGSNCVERRAYNVDDPPFWLLSRICERNFLILVLVKNSLKQSTLSTMLRRWNKLADKIDAAGGQVVVICESERRDVLALYHSHKLRICVVVDNTAVSDTRQSWHTYDNFLAASTPTKVGIPVTKLLGNLGDERLEISGANAGVIAVTREGKVIHTCTQRSKFNRTTNTVKKFAESAWDAIQKWTKEHAEELETSKCEEKQLSPISNVQQKIALFESKQESSTTPRKRQSIGRTATKNQEQQSKNVLVALLGQSTKLERILAHDKSRNILRQFLAKEHNSELVEYLEDLQEITSSNATSLSPKLYKTYIAPNSPKQLNLSSTMVSDVEDALDTNDTHQLMQVLSCVAMEVLQTLREDVFRRFLVTDDFQKAIQVLEPIAA